jgi:hypothetical protein
MRQLCNTALLACLSLLAATTAIGQTTSGARTLGFWANKNGQALETQQDFATLTECCLVNEDGSARDFTGTLEENKAALRSWLLGANAVNMAYKLSVQLAAMKLNLAHGFVDGVALVCAPGCGDQISISALISAANSALCSDGLTPSGDPNRGAQECLKDALDNANTDRPCP